MGIKENFNQAMQDVFPLYKGAKGGSADIAGPAENPDANNGLKAPIDFRLVHKPQKQPEITYISKDTRITGKIVSRASLDICGDVFGDVESENNLYISGSVEGNVRGDNIQIDNAVIKGNIHAAGRLEIINDSDITGDIQAGDLTLNSRVSGSIAAKRSADIQKGSLIVGDVTALTVNIEAGAVMKSIVTTTGEAEAEIGQKAE